MTSSDPSDLLHEKLQASRRVGLVLCSALYTFFVIGAFFGWGPMQLLLENNGSFSSRCTAEERERGEICPSQSSALVNVQFYAQVSQLTSPLLGQFVDHYGAKALAYFMTACVWVGLALFVVATKSIDELLYPAYVLIAQATWMGAILNLHAGMMFQGQTRSRVIFSLNSVFDAACVTYLGLWAISQKSGANLTQVIGGYLGLSVLLFGAGCYFWTVAEPVDLKDTSLDEPAHALREDNQSNIPAATPRSASELTEDAGVSNDNVDQTTLSETETTQVGAISDTNDGENAESQASELNIEMAEPAGSEHPSNQYIPLAQRTSFAQLTSPTFILVASFFTIHATSNQWALTTARDFLAFLGDDEVDNKYTLILSLVMPVSLLALPFTDAVLRKYGFHGGFQAINALALGYCLIRLLSDNLNVQILGFLIFSFYRCFLFGITFSFLPVVLASNVVGKGSGIMFAVTGLAAFVNVPLSAFALKQKNGDFFIPNLIYTFMIIPCIVAAWLIDREMRKEKSFYDDEIANAKLRQSYGGVLLGDLGEKEANVAQ